MTEFDPHLNRDDQAFYDPIDVIDYAYSRICPADESTAEWVDAKEWPAGDHGHTECWLLGGLLAEIRRLRETNEELSAELDRLYGSALPF